MTDITELAQRMSIERIKQIALGGTPTMGERESLAITALHFAEELKIATDAFQAAGLAQLAAEEALEKAQTKAIEQGRTACELFDEVTALRQRIAELESRTVKLPDDEDGQAYGFGKWANGKLPATAGTMTIAYCEDAWRAAFEVFSSTAGIKVETE
ncbi:hypothetical protein [Klebsiella quasipneumoniae]|uniref:hypothetical protein n=1 Tax=Klebsiella quasipneumoniae TaxID=1463165 RepID=UPI00384E98F0